MKPDWLTLSGAFIAVISVTLAIFGLMDAAIWSMQMVVVLAVLSLKK